MRTPALLSALALFASVANVTFGQAKPAVKRAAPAAKAPAAAATAAPAGKKSAFDKTALEAYVRHMGVWGPQIRVEISDPKPSVVPGLLEVSVRASAGLASQSQTFYVSRDGQKILAGNVYDINDNPFRKELEKLKTEFQASFGTPGAPVVLVFFSDFQCPFCKDEAKMLRQNLTSSYPKEVRTYFIDFPLEQIHPWAKAASMAGRCVFRQQPTAFWDYFDWMYDHQTEFTADNLRTKVLEWAKTKGLDTLALQQCIDTKATEAEVKRGVEIARALQVNQTPTVFVNGRRLTGGLSWPDLRQIIDYEIQYQKTARNAGEDCGCELRLPSPIK
jgi:protein-disulfide isomerase